MINLNLKAFCRIPFLCHAFSLQETIIVSIPYTDVIVILRTVSTRPPMVSICTNWNIRLLFIHYYAVCRDKKPLLLLLLPHVIITSLHWGAYYVSKWIPCFLISLQFALWSIDYKVWLLVFILLFTNIILCQDFFQLR